MSLTKADPMWEIHAQDNASNPCNQNKRHTAQLLHSRCCNHGKHMCFHQGIMAGFLHTSMLRPLQSSCCCWLLAHLAAASSSLYCSACCQINPITSRALESPLPRATSCCQAASNQKNYKQDSLPMLHLTSNSKSPREIHCTMSYSACPMKQSTAAAYMLLAYLYPPLPTTTRSSA